MPAIVMTGATSGIGRVAAGHLLARPGTRLIIGARGAQNAAGTSHLPLDLASLASVRSFAGAVVTALAGARIDALVLNAGGQRPDVEARSTDGHELTFAVNHLAHFALLRALEAHLAPGARVVITSSGTHDPAERTGVPPPHHAEAALLADPALDPRRDARPLVAGMRAYAASKLANLLTVRGLAARRPDLLVIAYDPGLTPGTGLVRDQHWAVRSLVWPLLPVLVRIRPGMNSLADAGRALAELATTTLPPDGRVYASLRRGIITWPDPSELARDDIVRDRLWADSLNLLH